MKIKYIIFIFSFLIQSVFLVSCYENLSDSQSEISYTVPENIGDGWDTASLNSVGMDEELMENLVDDIINEIYNEVHSIIIIKNDKLVFEEYFTGHDFNYRGQNFHGASIAFGVDIPHNTHSATKSVVSTLAGIAIEKGFIGSKDDKIISYFEPYLELFDEEKGNITIEHLLTMSSGLEWNEWDVPPGDPEYDTYLFNISSDPIAYILSKPVVTEPGTSFYYNGAGVDLLGEIVAIASNMALDVFAGQYLFEPMNVDSYKFQKHPSGMVYAHGDIYITPRTMAKYGYLLLNDGNWNDISIVSEDWINESITSQIQLPQLSWADEYGYLIWRKVYRVNNQFYSSYFAEGWGGQKIVVFPSLDMVAVFTGANYTTFVPCDEIIRDYIIPAIK